MKTKSTVNPREAPQACRAREALWSEHLASNTPSDVYTLTYPTVIPRSPAQKPTAPHNTPGIKRTPHVQAPGQIGYAVQIGYEYLYLDLQLYR